MKWGHSLSDRLGVHPAGFASGLQQLVSFRPPAWAYFLDFIVYPLLMAACAAVALRAGMRVGELLLLAAAGLALWTLAEYVLHRAAFHHLPMVRDGHFAHHHAPRELIGTPTLFSAAIFLVLVYAPLAFSLGTGPGSALSVGLLAGYLAYVAVHHAVHHKSSHGLAYLARLKRHHALHHHGKMDCNFGVTTRVWDRLFGTLR